MNFEDIANDLIDLNYYQQITFDQNYKSLIVDHDNVRIEIKDRSITILPIKNKTYA